MKLSDVEFRAMNSWWRRWGQKNVELPLFRRLGLDVRGRDVLEIGCCSISSFAGGIPIRILG